MSFLVPLELNVQYLHFLPLSARTALSISASFVHYELEGHLAKKREAAARHTTLPLSPPIFSVTQHKSSFKKHYVAINVSSSSDLTARP